MCLALPHFPAEQGAQGRVAVTGHQARRGQLAEHVVDLGGHQLQERAELGREQGPVTQESLVGRAGVAAQGKVRGGVGGLFDRGQEPGDMRREA